MEDLKFLIEEHLPESIGLGAIMTIIGFFNGTAVFTFPPVWWDLLKLFLINTLIALIVLVLFDLFKKWRKNGTLF